MVNNIANDHGYQCVPMVLDLGSYRRSVLSNLGKTLTFSIYTITVVLPKHAKHLRGLGTAMLKVDGRCVWWVSWCWSLGWLPMGMVRGDGTEGGVGMLWEATTGPRWPRL